MKKNIYIVNKVTWDHDIVILFAIKVSGGYKNDYYCIKKNKRTNTISFGIVYLDRSIKEKPVMSDKKFSSLDQNLKNAINTIIECDSWKIDYSDCIYNKRNTFHCNAFDSRKLSILIDKALKGTDFSDIFRYKSKFCPMFVTNYKQKAKRIYK